MSSSAFSRILRSTERGSFPGLPRFAWWCIYSTVARYAAWRWPYLNYGYLPAGSPFALHADDEPARAFIGLYHAALDGLPVAGARVLEVGCGLGGGASWTARSLSPASVIGVDLAGVSIARAKAAHVGVANLKFRVGAAEALPLPDASVDVLLNIESSHCYGSMTRFVQEGVRVLKPGGWFTWADMRTPSMLPELERAFAHPALKLCAAEELNEGVVRALDAMDAAKAAELSRFRLIGPLLREFAGMRGSVLHDGLRRRRVLYLARRYMRV
jgi:SAM-dependent methyltransferase